MNTKEIILKTSIDEFNKFGSGKITTNHIAKAVGISPGNLYYHYSNKEQIIREVFEIIIKVFDDLWIIDINNNSSFGILENLFIKNFQVQYKYRFFYYEINNLLHNDPLLRKRYLEIQDIRLKSIDNYFQFLIAKGVLKVLEDKTIYKNLSELSYFIGNFWMVQADISGRKYNEKEIQKNLFLMIDPIVQHLTDIGIKEYDEFKIKMDEKK